jgi:hypothetical protein
MRASRAEAEELLIVKSRSKAAPPRLSFPSMVAAIVNFSLRAFSLTA